MTVDFIPSGNDSALLDSNDKTFKVYANVMTALANQVRRITNSSSKLSVEDMTELLSNVIINVDTSDATAIAEYILKGYTAYVNGKKIVGTMPYMSGKTIVPGEQDILVVPAGTYVKGDIVVKAVVVEPGNPDEPSEPSKEVVMYDIELDSKSTQLDFTFNAEGVKPYAYKVEYVGTPQGEDNYIISVEGEFTHTGDYTGEATTRVTTHGASVRVYADIDQDDNTGKMRCRLSTVNPIFIEGTYQVELYYNKGA